MKISFGMIFSIILIIAFLAFAFYAMKFFLDFKEKQKLGLLRRIFKTLSTMFGKGRRAAQK